MSGAGKTTFSKELSAKYNNCPIIHVDCFYDCIAGRLKSDEIEKKFHKLRATPGVSVIIVEGVYSAMFDFDYDERYFFKISKEEQMRRISTRDPELYTYYMGKWIPAENHYFEEFNVEEKCDYVHETS
jgi:uridine kinase